MSEILGLILALLVGFGLGAVFFKGLWWTVRCIPRMKHPAVGIFFSLLLRLGISVTGFYFVARGGHWLRLLICLAGFFIVRYVLVKPVKKKLASGTKMEAE